MRQFAVWLARLPKGRWHWIDGLRPCEVQFIQEHGIAAFLPRAEHLEDLCPILRLALARNATPSAADVERAKWDVVRHMRTILRDETYMPRDLAASIAVAPRDLAVTLIRGQKADD